VLVGGFDGCKRCVSRVFHECFAGVSQVFRGCFAGFAQGVIREFRGCLAAVSQLFRAVSPHWAGPIQEFPQVNVMTVYKLSRRDF
jgi:hypothetical protein